MHCSRPTIRRSARCSSTTRIRWRWRRTELLKLLPSRSNLSFLLCSQHRGNLPHHLRVRNFQFDLDLRAGSRGRAHDSLVKGAAHWIRFALMQGPQLIEEGLIAFAKAFRDLLERGLLIISQIKIAGDWAKTVTRSRPSAKTTARRRALRSL